MADIKLFSPRKVTPQNVGHLPKSHDPNKRTAYVQITLGEDEIAIAIRNYVRTQVPVGDSDELPVVLVAGRGDNGHSAAVTVSAANVVVESVTQPVAGMEEFSAVSTTAAVRNAENNPNEVQCVAEASSEIAEAPQPVEEEIALPEAKSPSGEKTQKEIAQEAAIQTKPKEEEVTEEPKIVTPLNPPAVKKSNLFADPKPAPIEASVEKTDESVQVVAKKNIFDGV